MKRSTYELIVKAVMFGLPALADEVLTDLNATLTEYDTLKQPVKETTKKKEN